MGVTFNKWESDKLGRKRTAEYLTDYLITASQESKQREDSFVLNLNASWGVGKTHMINHWSDSLINLGYSVVKFDAWSNDYTKDPLLAFVIDISEQLRPKKEEHNKVPKKLDELLQSSSKLAKVSSPILISTLVKFLTGMSAEKIGGIFESTEDSEGGSDGADSDMVAREFSNISEKLAKSAIEDIKKSRETVAHFKKALGELVSELKSEDGKKTPLFIFVDELDRCKPTFSIEFLENVKHLFQVPDIVFVVATDAGQLSHAIGSVYGAGFDSTSYLRRFFHVEYQLPNPSTQDFSQLLLEDLTSEMLRKAMVPNIEFDNLHAVILTNIFEVFRVPARDRKRVWELIKAVLFTRRVAGKNTQFLFLCVNAVIFQLYPDVYSRFAREGFNPSLISSEIEYLAKEGSNIANIPFSEYLIEKDEKRKRLRFDCMSLYKAYLPLMDIGEESFLEKYHSLNSAQINSIPKRHIYDIFYVEVNSKREIKPGKDFLGLRDHMEAIRQAGFFSNFDQL